MTELPEPFILYPDPRLAQKATPQPIDDETRAIGARLLSAAVGANAYGLAAVHIGTVASVVVVSLGDRSGRDYRLFYNPQILASGGAEEEGVEGSVSMPGIEVAVRRPASVRIGFDDETGQPQELDLFGFAARIAQHEIDQVNGVFFLARVSRLKRDAALRKFSKMGRKG